MTTIINIQNALAAQAQHDAVAGIAIAKLLDADDLSFFVTEIAPGNSVAAHYHEHGQEIYIILKGQGLMKTAHADGTHKQVQDVHAGDIFSIHPYTTHRLENNSTLPLVLLFAGHANHLSSDRIVQTL